MSASDARRFFLKPESYSTISLPPYFNFSSVLGIAEKYLFKGDVDVSKAKGDPRANYVLLSNKDGNFAWRPLQLINPILYVDLVQKITEESSWNLICSRFQEFRKNPKIECVSIPIETEGYTRDLAETILNWKSKFEQKSVVCALKYSTLVKTDISNCYGSVYTHSIAWALHGKEAMKNLTNRRRMSLLGNVIDSRVQGMQWGQTNGIPQGSVLMDFVVELILGYADNLLGTQLEKALLNEYKILRFRDDYRIFTNSTQDAETIVKYLSSVLCDLNFRLNTQKTSVHSEIILNSLKRDSVEWTMKRECAHRSLIWDYALNLYQHTLEYGVTGSIIAPMTDFCERIWQENIPQEQILPLLSIVTEIAFRNPKAYPPCMDAIAGLTTLLNASEKREACSLIWQKFNQLPNAGHLQIWLQRIFSPIKECSKKYQEALCNVVGQSIEEKLWSFNWLKTQPLKAEIMNARVICDKTFNEIKPQLSKEELRLFIVKSELTYL